MCNLSQGIREAGIEEGLLIGRQEGLLAGREEGEAALILKMYKNGFTAEQIAAATDKGVEEVKAILDKNRQ